MRKKALLVLAAVLLLSARVASAQVSAPTKVDLKEEGASQGRVGQLNCVGSSITCTVSADTGTLTLTSGGANTVEKSVDLGTGGGLVYTATVTGQTWVGASSVIVCGAVATTADGQTLETYYAAGFVVTVSNRVAGTGFDISVLSPYGATGTFRFNCTGA